MELTPHQQLLRSLTIKLMEYWENDIQPELLSPEGMYYDFRAKDVISGYS